MMALLVYLVIAVSQLQLRRTLVASKALKVRMWMHPFPGLFVVVLIVAAFVVMVCGQDHREEVVSTLGMSSLLALTGMVVEWRRRQRNG